MTKLTPGVLLALVVLPLHVYPAECTRDASLQAANDELTLRVAELLEENRNLRRHVENALVAASQGRPVVVGCDPQELRRELVTSDGWPSTATDWIDANQSECTVQQLEYIYQNIDKWSSKPMATADRLLRYYIDQR